MNLIVAVDKNWAIGKNNELLISIPEDMKFFRETTKDSVVIMGRKTLESFPNGQPLKNRINIVITRDTAYQKDGVLIAHSTDEAIAIAKTYDKNIFVIGGASIYKQMLNMCTCAYVTKIDEEYDEADAYFPNLDSFENWEIESESDIKLHNKTPYKFIKYMNKYTK